MNKRKARTPLAVLMAERGLSDNELARLVGMKQPTISRIASGATKSPKEETLAQIADYLGVTTAELRGKAPAGVSEKAAAYSGLSSEAIEVARAWMKIDKDLRGSLQQLVLYLAAAQSVAQWLVLRPPKSPHYRDWEQAIQEKYDIDTRQRSLDLEP